MRAVKETLYQSERPRVVDHSKFARPSGSRPTPHEQAIAETLAWLPGKPTVTVCAILNITVQGNIRPVGDVREPLTRHLRP